MEKVQSELADLKEQSGLVASSLKALTESLQGLGTWMPKVDTSITSILKSLDEVGNRVTALEAARSSQADETPRLDGHRREHLHQGLDSGAIGAPGPALGRGKRTHSFTPVQFELGDHSGKDHAFDDSCYTHQSAARDMSYSRMPKTDFPRFDGENPKWWKAVCEKYFTTYDVNRETWASFATMHFTGNAALWLTNYEAVNEIESWEELVVAVHTKFGKKQAP